MVVSKIGNPIPNSLNKGGQFLTYFHIVRF
jgi:hypothetical protein